MVSPSADLEQAFKQSGNCGNDAQLTDRLLRCLEAIFELNIAHQLITLMRCSISTDDIHRL